MTAPSPAGLSPLLDQLDEARAKATPGPWQVEDEWVWGDVSAWGACGELVTKAEDLEPADAALIVAAVNALPDLITKVRELDARIRAGLDLHQLAEPCSCGGRRWTEDKNWSPPYPELWRGERSEGAGLIPCGFCNHGGWNTDQHEPVDPFCEVCDLPWPCPTTAALAAALTPGADTAGATA